MKERLKVIANMNSHDKNDKNKTYKKKNDNWPNLSVIYIFDLLCFH